MRARLLTLLLLILAAPACQSGAQAIPEPTSPPPTRATLVPPADWIDARVSDAHQRLDASDAGKLVRQAIDAHGGLATWYGQGPIQFRFNYVPRAKGEPRDTRQLVDTWSARAVHTMSDNPEQRFGWDGKSAWMIGEPPMNARFWSLTPFFFVAIPFVLADEGVNLSLDGEATWEGQTYDLVRVTFGQGVGDAPDDFYVVYLHRQTRRLGAMRYVVSYPGFFPEGGHSPEKLMSCDGAQTINGITLPQSYRTFAWVDGAPGEHVTDTTLSEVAFRPDLPADTFDIPPGATIQDKY